MRKSSSITKWARKARRLKDQSTRLAVCLEAGVDWKTRTVYVVGALSEEKAYQYIPALRLLDETAGPIKVVVMSPGGEESGGFALFDTIRTMRNRVVTIGFGGIYSIAALIFQAGRERLLAPNAQYMMHNGSITLDGGDINTDMVEALAAEAAQNNKRYHKAIADRAGAPLKSVEDWCKAEKYFLAEEAVTAGLADRIVSSWEDLK